MISNITLSGYYKGIEDEMLLLKLDNVKNTQIIRISINNVLKENLEKCLIINDVIGVKGYINIDNINKIIVIATKIMFLSNK